MHGTFRYVSRNIPLRGKNRARTSEIEPELTKLNRQKWCLLERQDAVVHPQRTTLEKNDAVLLGLAFHIVSRAQIPEVVGEELPHALLIALLLVLHIRHEALRLSIPVGSL